MNDHKIIDNFPPEYVGGILTHTEFNALINYVRAQNYDVVGTTMLLLNQIVGTTGLVFKGWCAPTSAVPASTTDGDTYLIIESGIIFGVSNCIQGNILVQVGGLWEQHQFLIDGGAIVDRLAELSISDSLSTSNIQHNGSPLDTFIDSIIYDRFTLLEDGLVPGPVAYEGKFLKDDGTWSNPVQTGNFVSNKPSIITITGGTGSIIGTGTAIDINKASSTQGGYLSKEDWITFNAGGASAGTVTEVISNSPLQLAVSLANTTPTLSILTDTVTETSDALTTGAQVSAFVTSQGYLTAADIANKEDKLTKGNVTSISPVVISGQPSNSVIGSGVNISMPKATSTQDGYMSKENIVKLNTITQTTGTVKTIVSGDGKLNISSDPTNPIISVIPATIANGNIYLTTGSQVYNFVYTRDISIFNNNVGYITAAQETDPVWNAQKSNYFNKNTDVLSVNHLPAAALTKVRLYNNEIDQLTNAFEEGDIVFRTDLDTSFVHNGGNTGTINDWQEFLFPGGTGLVSSVNGKVGTVVLTTTDINEGTNLYYTDTRVSANSDVVSSITHINRLDNPHNTTKSQVGLGNVDNTSDANKPLSISAITALNLKIDKNTPITGGTHTKITYDSDGLVTAGSLATTADIAPSTNRNYVTDAQLVVIQNASGINTGDQDISGINDNAIAISDLQEEQVIQNSDILALESHQPIQDNEIAANSAKRHNPVTVITNGYNYITWNDQEITLNPISLVDDVTDLLPTASINNLTGFITNHADVAANTVHRTSDGSDHTFIDQSVIIGAIPEFAGTYYQTGITQPTHREGLVFYDVDKKALSYYNESEDVTINMGQELVFRVFNASGAPIPNGAVVYPMGTSIGLANARHKHQSKLIAVATETIPNNDWGYITKSGQVGSLNTSGYSVGDIVYLSDTVPGTFTTDRPIDGGYAVIVGVIDVVDPVDGIITVDTVSSEITVEVTDTNGFPVDQRNTTSLSVDNLTRTFTITSSDGHFHYYVSGDKFESESGTESVVFSNLTGKHWLYFDKTGLKSLYEPSPSQKSDIIINYAFVSYIIWDADAGNIVFDIFDERHGITMDATTHAYLHLTRGTQFLEGLSIGDIIPDATGSLDAHAQFSVEAGAITDEDLRHNIPDFNVGDTMSVAYLTGIDKVQSADRLGFAVLTTGTGRLAYNYWNGASWSLAECPSNTYVLYHIFAINGTSINKRLVSVVGQNYYSSISEARGAAVVELQSIRNGFDVEESIPLGTIIYQTKDSYSNGVKARIISTGDGYSYVNWLTTELAQGIALSDHNNLIGLDLANSGVTWGHISDQAQIIYGVKTFNSTPKTLGTPIDPEDLVNYGTITGLTNLYLPYIGATTNTDTGVFSITTSTLTTKSALPYVVLDETDQTGANGLARIQVSNNEIALVRNTSAGRDFGTLIELLKFNTSNNATFVGRITHLDGVGATDSATKGQLDTAVSGRMKYRGEWQPVTYFANDVAYDSGWTGVALITTTDRVAPQPDGNPEFLLPPTPTWVEQSITQIVRTGIKLTFNQTGWVKIIRVWVPEVTATTNYRYIVKNITDPLIPIVTIVEEPDLNEAGWTSISIGQRLINPGDVYEIIQDSYNSGSITNITGNWTYGGTDNVNPPASQSWNINTQASLLRISDTDLGSVDRTSELSGIIPNTKFTITQVGDSTKYVEFTVLELAIDEGAYFSIVVEQTGEGNGGITVGQPSTLSIDVPVIQTTKYVESVNYWLTGQPSWATVEGFLKFNGVDQGVTNNAYGIDIQFQPAYISPDWGFLAASEGGGAGGGITISTYVGLSDTPETLTANALQRVNATGDALINAPTSSLNLSDFTDDITSGIDLQFVTDNSAVTTNNITINSLYLPNEGRIYAKSIDGITNDEIIRYSADDDLILGQSSDRIYIRTSGSTRTMINDSNIYTYLPIITDNNITIGGTPTSNSTHAARMSDLFSGLAGKSNVGHTHTLSEILDYSIPSLQQVTDISSITTNTITAAGFIGPLTGNVTGDITGNAGTSSKWLTARTITLTGDVTGSTSIDGSSNVSITTTVANDSHTHSEYLLNTTDTLTGSLTVSQYIKTMSIRNTTHPGITTNDLGFYSSSAGYWMRFVSNAAPIKFFTDGDATNDYNGLTAVLSLNSGNTATFAGNVTAPTFIGNLTGNATTATTATSAAKWTTSRTFTLSGDVTGSTSFDGSGNISITTAVGDNSHSHSNYLLNTTDELNGNLTITDVTDPFLMLRSAGVGNDVNSGAILFREFDDSYGMFIKHDGSANSLLIGSRVNAVESTKVTINRETGNTNFVGTVTAPTFIGALTGNATTATTATSAAKWTTARTITLSGDVTGTSSAWDGSGNATLTTVVQDDSHNHIISNVDGLQTALDGKSNTGHNHTGIYEPADVTILKDADIGVSVQAYNADTVIDALYSHITVTSSSVSDGVNTFNKYILPSNVMIEGENVSLLINDSGYLTSEIDPIFVAHQAYNITAQNITDLGNLSGTNTGDQDLSGLVPYTGASTGVNLGVYSITATSLIKSGGTSSQFLKADGSVDSSTYLTGNQTITLSGDVSGSGTTSIAVTVANDSHTHATQYLGLTANAVSASKWATGRTITLSGDASGTSSSWDGSGNATLVVTVADDSHNHVISNIDGLQTALDNIIGGALVDDVDPGGDTGTLWYNPAKGEMNLRLDSNWVLVGGGIGTDGAVSDGAVTYDKIADTLITDIVDNDGTWDFSSAGLINAAISINTTVTFSNLQQNKTLKVKLTISNSSTITWPSYCSIVTDNDPSGVDGTYYMYFDCWENTVSSELVIVSIVEAP